jgi:hypothetical protein
MTLNPFRFFTRPPRRGGGKARMFTTPFLSRSDAPAAPPTAAPSSGQPGGEGGRGGAGGGGDRLSALLDAVGRLADQQRSLLDALRPSPVGGPPMLPAVAHAAHAEPPAGAGSRPVVSADDVRAVVADALRSHAASAARDAYARDHLADLPDAYRRLLPAGGDPAALASAEQAIRRQFRDDLRAVARGGGTGGAGGGGMANPPGDPAARPDRYRQDVFADVGGDDDAVGRPPAAAVDYAKLSPLQQIAVGLRGTVARALPAGGGGNRPTARAADAASAGTDAPDPHEELFVGAD